MGEPLPLATVHEAVLQFLRGRDDAVLFGAQAVNAYVDEARMTQDVDVLAPRAGELAEELREFLRQRFKIAVRMRTSEAGFRIYQVRRPRNRHLVDVRPVKAMPEARRVAEVLVLAPVELIATKVRGMVARSKTAKGLTDAADLRRLLLAFPDLKRPRGPVLQRLRDSEAGEKVLAEWARVAAEEILPDEE
ncbi:MAG: nucleotidyl transferase AbiEii/AbiGii toxin family protein [Candidatus Binatia bacterium]